MKRWICTVCKYIHEGEAPPETCPICSAPSSDFELLPEKSKAPPQPSPEKTSSGEATKNRRMLQFLTRHFPLFQFHPITAHFPNGLIPVSLFFLVLALLFDFECVEKTAFYLLCSATVIAPLTVATGIYNWKTRYRGAVTGKFLFKLIGGFAFTVLALATVIWRLLNPQVVEVSGGWYFLVNLALLALVVMLGHIGGGLVFGGARRRN